MSDVALVAKRVVSQLLRPSEAAVEYANAEKKAATKSKIIVALVSTDSIGGLREAYPNYFADSTLFAANLVAFKHAYEEFRPSGFFGKLFGR